MVKVSGQKTARWSRKKLFFFSVITILIILIVLEIICRVVFYFDYKGYHTTAYIQGSPLQVSDSLLVYRNTPFYVDYKRRFQFNEEGMKDAPGDVFIPAKTENDFWVLLTGGSAMEGMGSNRNGEWLDITGIEDHAYNQTIASYLQQSLQESMPDKKVKVFNAATSGYTLYQSYYRYLSLADRLKPDWVISMDGVNEPPVLKQGQTVEAHARAYWRSYPQFHYPLNIIVSLTKHSALINMLKQKLFHIKNDYRLKKAADNGYPERKLWAAKQPVPLKTDANNEDIHRAVNSFLLWMNKYDSTLSARHQHHLLLIQPHISMRDTSALGPAERAVNNYYRSAYQDSTQQSFLFELYNRFSTEDSIKTNILPMRSVHHWPEWIFVDYCHFTNTATKKIAKEIFDYISSGATIKPFR